MTEMTDDVRRARHQAIRVEVAQEESDAAEAEVVERAAALDVPLHLRIDRELDVESIARRVAREELRRT